MRAPKGFGKNYFTFAAVQAYSVATTLQAQHSSTTTLLEVSRNYNKEEDEQEESPPELLASPYLRDTKPCHCNCFYNLRTKIALLINHFIPRCPYYTTYFAFRRTGVHLPFVTL